MPTSSDLRQLWFFNTCVTIRVSYADGSNGVSVIEHKVPAGDSPPLHTHRNEDEIFHVIEGEVRFRLGDEERVARRGETVLTPKGVAHTYLVTSPEGARLLTITRHEEFERFVRAIGRPAEHEGLPAPMGPPTPAQIEAVANVAGQHNITFVGPPLS